MNDPLVLDAPSRWRRWLFGSDPRLAPRIQLTLIASGLYAMWALVQWVLLDMGLSAHPALSLLSIGLMLMAATVPLGIVRSGLTAHLKDPALVLPQCIMGLLIGSLSYVLLPDMRGPLLQVMCLIHVFGLFSLTPRQVVVACLTSLASLAMAWWLGAHLLDAQDFNRTEEALHLLAAGFIMCLLSSLSHAYSQARGRSREHKQQLAVAVSQVAHIVAHDALTGLYNRHHMVTALQRELSRSDLSGTPFAVTLIDLDHFKQINDQHGHAVGDEVLESFAQLATEILRETDVIGRWGGEEFLVLLLDADPSSRAMIALDRLRATLAQAIVSRAVPELRLTFSAGVAIPVSGETMDGVLERADQSLYRAKHEGRNRTMMSP